MPKRLIVFDFDYTFVDQDTDRWPFEVLSTPLRREWENRKKAAGAGSSTESQCIPDITFVVSPYAEDRHDVLILAHEQGITKEMILNSFKPIPLVSHHSLLRK
jgi:pyridoxal phosphate phosphatase PHOSPHO2